MQRHFNFMIQYTNLKQKLWNTSQYLFRCWRNHRFASNEITCTLNICSKWYWSFYARVDCKANAYYKFPVISLYSNPIFFLCKTETNFQRSVKFRLLLKHQIKNYVCFKKSLTIVKLKLYNIGFLKIKTNHNFLAIFVKDILKLRYVSWNPGRGHPWT